jgi:crotonobetaine/carnitine-CoA ligase
VLQPIVGPKLTDTACVIYTSGTTGASKGAEVSWLQFFESALSGTIPEDRRGREIYYAPFGPFHSTGKLPVCGAVVRRSEIVIRERFSTARFWSDIDRFKCTSTLLVGAMANFIYRQPPTPADSRNTLRDVLMVPVIPEVDDFKRRFNVDVHTCFNMTELSVPILSGGAPVTSDNYRSCGRLREGYSVRIVDESGSECGPSVAGELWVRADNPAAIVRGYFGMADKTREAFVDGWFRTGDLFKRDANGNYYFLDRLKDYIRRRGENISSFEIEASVCTHESVLECAAVAVPSEWGEEEVKIAVVPRPGQRIDCAALYRYLSSRVPSFAMPRYIEVLDALPRTATDRVRKVALRQSGVSAATWDSQVKNSVPAKHEMP